MRGANIYSRVAADSVVAQASPHHLVQMLFDGLVASIHAARGAIARQDVAAKGVALTKAARIIEEGLKGGLDMEKGGKLSANLRQVYDFCLRRVTEANLRNDPALLQEVLDAIDPVAKAWKEIAPGAGTPAAALQSAAQAQTQAMAPAGSAPARTLVRAI